MREVDLTYSAEAVIEAVRQSTVSAQISGRIVELRFDVGDCVKKGEVIVRIDERAAGQALAASEAQVREADAAARNARVQYERSRQLLAQKFISQAALDKAEADYKQAQARLSAMLAGAGQAATERSFATIVAPYSGVVSARHVELGEMAVARQAAHDRLRSRPRCAWWPTCRRRRSPAIQAGGTRAHRGARRSAAGSRCASVTVVPSADPRTHTTQVRLELPDGRARHLSRACSRARISSIGRAPRLLVPRAAVFQRSEVTGVYVVDDKGAPRLRQIRLGTAGDERAVEVLAGLKPGERVALEPVKAGHGRAARPR